MADSTAQNVLRQLQNATSLQEAAQTFEDYLHSTYPSNMWQAGSSALKQYTDGSGSIFDAIKKLLTQDGREFGYSRLGGSFGGR